MRLLLLLLGQERTRLFLHLVDVDQVVGRRAAGVSRRMRYVQLHAGVRYAGLARKLGRRLVDDVIDDVVHLLVVAHLVRVAALAAQLADVLHDALQHVLYELIQTLCRLGARRCRP